MTKSGKLPRRNRAPSQGRETQKSQREGDLLRENLKRRKLQTRTKARLEKTVWKEPSR